MADDITNKVLLEHILAMKTGIDEKIDSLIYKIEDLQNQINGLTVKMNQGFEDARQHRQALQEDLEATMLMLSKHEKKLARL